MSQTVLYRIAALALVVGAVLVTVGNLLAPQGDARAAVESPLYYPLALVVLLGGLLVMAGWTAVYLRQRAESGVLFGVATIRARIFSRPLGIGTIVLALASFVLGFLSLPGGGGIHMSWWWATTGTFGVVAYMVVMAWSGIELFQSVGEWRRDD